jgi:hypothetical protein
MMMILQVSCNHYTEQGDQVELTSRDDELDNVPDQCNVGKSSD